MKIRTTLDDVLCCFMHQHGLLVQSFESHLEHQEMAKDSTSPHP